MTGMAKWVNSGGSGELVSVLTVARRRSTVVGRFG